MNTMLEDDELNLPSKGDRPFGKRDWDTEELRKRAEKDAAEIIRKTGVRETFRECFKSIRPEKINEIKGDG